MNACMFRRKLKNCAAAQHMPCAKESFEHDDLLLGCFVNSYINACRRVTCWRHMRVTYRRLRKVISTLCSARHSDLFFSPATARHLLLRLGTCGLERIQGCRQEALSTVVPETLPV